MSNYDFIRSFIATRTQCIVNANDFEYVFQLRYVKLGLLYRGLITIRLSCAGRRKDTLAARQYSIQRR